MISLANNAVSLTSEEYRAKGKTGYLWLIDHAFYLSLTGKEITGSTDQQTKEVTINKDAFTISLKYSRELGLVYPEFDLTHETKFNIYSVFAMAIKEGEMNNLFI